MKKNRKAYLLLSAAILLTVVFLVPAGCEKKDDSTPDIEDWIKEPSTPGGDEIVPRGIAEKLQPVLKEARAAAGRASTNTARAEWLALQIQAYDYSARPDYTVATHLDPLPGRSSDLAGLAAAPPRTYADKPSAWAAELAGLGSAALSPIIDYYILSHRLGKRRAKIQLLAPLHKLKADDDIIDRFLLCLLANETRPSIRGVAAQVVLSRRHEPIVPGLLDIAASGVSGQRIATVLSLIFNFQYPFAGRSVVKLTEKQMAPLRREMQNREEYEETTLVLFARVLVMQGGEDATDFLIDTLSRTRSRSVESALLNFFGDRKITAATDTLLQMLQAVRDTNRLIEIIWTLGEIGGALDESEKDKIVAPLAAIINGPVRPEFSAEVSIALAKTAGAAAVETLIGVMDGHRQPGVRLHGARALARILGKGNAPDDSLKKIIEAALALWDKTDDDALQYACIGILAAATTEKQEEWTPHVIDALLHLLRHGRSQWLRSGAAEALGNYPCGTVVDALLVELDASESDEVRFYIIKSLGVIGDARAAERLLDIAMSGSAALIEACARSMAVLSREGAFNLDNLYDQYSRPATKEEEKANILRCISQIRGESADRLLLEILKTEQGALLKRDTLKYIGIRLLAGGCVQPDLEDVLIGILKSPSRSLYIGTINLLAGINGTKSVPSIITVLKDNIEDKPLRTTAFAALAQLGGDEAAGTLLGLVSDLTSASLRDKAVYERAAEVFNTLGKFDRKALYATLKKLIADPPDDDMLFAALIVTTIFEDKRFNTALRKIMRDESASTRVRCGAIYALGGSCDEKALPYLEELIAGEQGEIARSTAKALGDIGRIKAAQSLIDRLRIEKIKENGDFLLIDIIVDSLRQIAIIEDHGKDPTAWQEWYNEMTKAADTP